MKELTSYGEDLFVEGDVRAAQLLLGNLLTGISEITGILLNDIAVLHIAEGNFRIAKWLLEYIVREGYNVEKAKQNLQKVEDLLSTMERFFQI